MNASNQVFALSTALSETALLRVVNGLLMAIRTLILLDISSAFDTLSQYSHLTTLCSWYFCNCPVVVHFLALHFYPSG